MSGVAPIADMPSHGWETSFSAKERQRTAANTEFDYLVGGAMNVGGTDLGSQGWRNPSGTFRTPAAIDRDYGPGNVGGPW